ncbi:MAG: hypothetical protein P0119_05265 [Nitrospira sp.]|nr:hypothetical protein [Nitrospira sp.]
MKTGQEPCVIDVLEIDLLLDALCRACKDDFRGYARPSLTRRLARAGAHEERIYRKREDLCTNRM